MRILGIDYGLARIGLALSDERLSFAHPYKTLAAKKNSFLNAQALAEELKAIGPLSHIVIGLPIHLSGKESPLSKEVRQFVDHLKALTEIPIVLWDERLTTAGVERSLKDSGMRRKQRSQIIDQLAASEILQNFLDWKRSSS